MYTDHIDFPSKEEKEKSIREIVSHGVCRPQRLGSALWELWRSVGLYGFCFGVWDCMLLALLLDGVLWAFVYTAARQSPQMTGILFFGASPILYAMLHLLTVWKETAAGMYQSLMVCRLSLRQMSVLRLFIFGSASVLLMGVVNVGFAVHFQSGIDVVFRMIGLSVSALFCYALMQLVLEWKWKSRMSFAAAPVLWCGISILLLSSGEYGQKMMGKIPTVSFFVCGALFAWLHVRTLRKYYFELQEAAVWMM